MTGFEDRQRSTLPRPPAPTRRSANPWNFSSTARIQDSPPPGDGPGAIDRLNLGYDPVADQATRHQPETPAAQTLPREPGRGPRFSALPLVVLGMAALVVLRMLMRARGAGDWAGFAMPLLFFLVVAYGAWKRRRRRNELRSTKSD